MQEIWLPPNSANPKTLGRFEDFTKTITDKDGTKKSITKLMLYTKVPGVAEPSSQSVLNDPEGDRIKAEYALAWELYLKNKEAPKAEAIPMATEYGVKGTPIEHADFLGKDQTARLKMMGFLTLEQLADMSDVACNNVGFGAKNWRKKAGEYLAARVAHPSGPSTADLQRQLVEAQAQIAALMAVVALPAPTPADAGEGPVEAPKPRRGRPPKTEAQAEA